VVDGATVKICAPFICKAIFKAAKSWRSIMPVTYVPTLKRPLKDSLPNTVLYTHAPIVKSSLAERAKAGEEGTVSQGPLALEAAVRSR